MALVFDIETNGLLKELTTIHCLCIGDTLTGVVDAYSVLTGDISVGLKRLLEADQIIGFNSLSFDLPALTKVYPEMKALEERTSWTRNLDLILVTRLKYPDTTGMDFNKLRSGFPRELIGRHSLKAWGHRIGVIKGTYGETSDWAVCTPEMVRYCAQDIEVTLALYKHLKVESYSSEAIQLEHDVRRYIQWQETCGVPFDVAAARNLYLEVKNDYEKKWEEVKHLFPDKVEEREFIPKTNHKPRGYKKGVPVIKTKVVPFNVGSRQQLIEYFKTKYNWIPVDFTEKGSPEIGADVLNAMPYPEAKIISELFDMRKLMGNIFEGNQGWIKLVENGRIHGKVTTNGAISGRATHWGPNLAQVPAAHAYRGKECRQLFHAPEGWKFVGGDAAALEMRLFAHYLAAYDGGSYKDIVLNGDIHSENQKSFGVEERSTAKTLIFAMLYGCGAVKAGMTIKPDATDMEAKAIGQRAIGNFKSAVPAYRRLIEDVYAALKTRGYLKGLDGRILIPRSQHAGLNTLIQGAGAIVMKKAIQLFHERIKVFGDAVYPVLWIHDEIQCIARPEIAEEVASLIKQSIRDAGTYYNLKCPMDGTAKVGNNWLDTH